MHACREIPWVCCLVSSIAINTSKDGKMTIISINNFGNNVVPWHLP